MELALLSADESRLKTCSMNTTTAHNDSAATCFASEADNPIPLELLQTSEVESYRSSLTETELAWLDRQGFAAKSGQFAWLERDGAARVVCGWDGKDNLSTLGAPHDAARGHLCVNERGVRPTTHRMGFGWLSVCSLQRGETCTRTAAPPAGADSDFIINTTLAVALCRDLINTPAQDMAPSHLAAEVQALADTFGATCDITEGDAYWISSAVPSTR